MSIETQTLFTRKRQEENRKLFLAHLDIVELPKGFSPNLARNSVTYLQHDAFTSGSHLIQALEKKLNITRNVFNERVDANSREKNKVVLEFLIKQARLLNKENRF